MVVIASICILRNTAYIGSSAVLISELYKSHSVSENMNAHITTPGFQFLPKCRPISATSITK